MEYTVGDLWNQSGDRLLQNTSITTNALMIPNIARFLGASKHVSPRIPALSSITRYSFKFTDWAGGYYAVLDFPPASGCTTWNWSGTSTPSVTPVANLGDIDTNNEWYVDTDTGIIYFYNAIQADWVLEYEPQVDGDINSDSRFNVIPDLDTDASYAFQSVKIEYVNGTDNAQGYYIYLPPRGPLNNRRLRRSPQDDVHTPAHTANFDATPTSGQYYMWQSDSVDATITSGYAEHYRYLLPKIITDEGSALATLPGGMLYLWDATGSGTVLEGVTFKFENSGSPRGWVIVATGTALDNYLATSTGTSKYPSATLQSSSHASTSYPSGGLRLITIGQDVSSSLSELWQRFLDHDHSSSNSMASYPVSHELLRSTFYPDDTGTGSPKFHASSLTYDQHPQYLHRKGLDASARDNYKNGMLGDLFFCSTNSATNYDNLSAVSNGIRFGNSSTGPLLKYFPTSPGSDRLAVQYKGLALVTSGCTFKQGYQSGYIQPELTQVHGFTEWEWNVDYYRCTSNGDIWFCTTDWPEDCTINRFELDWDGNGNTLYANFYLYTWGASGVSAIGLGTSTSGATRVTGDSFTTGLTLTNMAHATHKVYIKITGNINARLYGIRAHISYYSVNKWAPLV